MKILHRKRTPVPRDSARDGFTLVEVMVALVILTIGILGLAATTMFVIRQTTMGELSTERAAALQTVIEDLRTMDYDAVQNGSDSVGIFAVNWRVMTASRSKLVEVVTVGPGFSSTPGGQPSPGPSVADTFVYRIIRP